jgi:transcriptional regulator with XRE-family HTH domain
MMEKPQPYQTNLRELIEENGYTFKEVSEETGISLSALFIYARGERSIPHKSRYEVARVIGCSEVEIVSKRISQLEIRKSTEEFITDSDKLDQAESIINLAWEAWFASRPNAAARPVSKLLPELEKTAYSPYLLHTHTLRAKELVSRAHGLLGSVCSDALQSDTALFHHMQAQRFAEEIHDGDMVATHLCLIGEVLRQQENYAGGLSRMETARDKAVGASKATRGYILQLLAYTYGDTGQEGAFEHAISEATDLLAFSGEGKDITQKEFIPFEIYEIRGKINRDLGRPLRALPYLDLAEQSLITGDSVTPRWHALLEISRGQALCDAGDIKTGVDAASKGFLLAYQCRSPHQMKRVRKLLRKLENSHFKNHSEVQDLKTLLYETYMRMDDNSIM